MSAEELCDPRRNSREESIQAARRHAEDRQSYDIEIFRYLTQQLLARKVDVEVVERALEVLAAIAPTARLHGAIRATLSHDDAKIRSKAAVVLGRSVADLPLLQRLLSDSDARVRANTLEALWHLKSAEIESIFLKALGDSGHRAVANATYGLYLIDSEKYFPKATELIAHPLSGHRAAGAWLLGKIGDPHNLPLLKPLLLEKSTDARSAAFRTLKILRTAVPVSS
jgi:HEAT repeat protein